MLHLVDRDGNGGALSGHGFWRGRMVEEAVVEGHEEGEDLIG